MPLQTSLSPQPTKLGPEPLVFYLWAAVAGDVVAVVVAAVGGGNLALGVQLPNTTARSTALLHGPAGTEQHRELTPPAAAVAHGP